MTLHSAKGLEFPVVFMTGMEDGVFPLSRAIDEPEELEEERRLCYVGMTRAKEILYLTRAEMRTLYGYTNVNLPSRFLKEVPEELLEAVGTARRMQRPRGPVLWRWRRFRWYRQYRQVQAGQPYTAPHLGHGHRYKGEHKGDDTEITIAFPGLGVKRCWRRWHLLKALK